MSQVSSESVFWIVAGSLVAAWGGGRHRSCPHSQAETRRSNHWNAVAQARAAPRLIIER